MAASSTKLKPDEWVKTPWDFRLWNKVRLTNEQSSVQIVTVHALDIGADTPSTPNDLSMAAATLTQVSPWFKEYLECIEKQDIDKQSKLLRDVGASALATPHQCVQQPPDQSEWQIICLNGVDEKAYAYFHMYAGTGYIPALHLVVDEVVEDPERLCEELRPHPDVPGDTKPVVVATLVDAYDLAVRLQVPGLQVQINTLLKAILEHFPELLTLLPEGAFLRWFTDLHMDSQPILEVLTRSMIHLTRAQRCKDQDGWGNGREDHEDERLKQNKKQQHWPKWEEVAGLKPDDVRAPVDEPLKPFQHMERLFRNNRFVTTFESLLRRILVTEGVISGWLEAIDHTVTPRSNPCELRPSPWDTKATYGHQTINGYVVYYKDGEYIEYSSRLAQEHQKAVDKGGYASRVFREGSAQQESRKEPTGGDGCPSISWSE